MTIPESSIKCILKVPLDDLMTTWTKKKHLKSGSVCLHDSETNHKKKT